MKNSKCKICRRAGAKLFLKGERCFSQKCPMIRRPFPPGKKGKRRPRALSEFGKELREKQKLKNWYNLRENQFRKYVKKVLDSRHKVEDAESFLVKLLESRLDNVVFRLGFAASRTAARQMISHRHFLVNGRTVNIPSYSVKKGDKISVNPKSSKKPLFKNTSAVLKKQKPPSWLKLSPDKLEGEIVGEPNFAEAAPPAEILSIFEFYSR